MKLRRLALTLLSLLSISSTPLPQTAPPDPKPFGLPFAEPPGPSTWLLGQPYGNTTFAYRTRVSQYGAGQGLHFGIDFPARCGTTAVAVGDGAVTKVDAAVHGAGPHNLMILHENGYASFYGHLLEAPSLFVGQRVLRGEPVALTGDPDLTCKSRPHLHLEIRDSSYRHAYNPALFIDADWDSLALASPFGLSFSRNLDAPRQWQSLQDQPDVTFGGRLLNDYARAWPPDWR